MNNKFDILVIDDEQVIIDSLIKIAESEGLSINPMGETTSAITNLKKEEYKLIISDIMMPVMDGFAFLREIKKMNIITPIIMTTGYSTIENAVKSLSNGAFDYIPKPFDLDEMISVIRRGIKYHDLLKNTKQPQMLHVPCPPKFFRLGNLSWMNLQSEGVVSTGVTNLFMQTVENIKSIELLEINDLVIQSNPFAKIYTHDDLIHCIPSPIGGRIVERNSKIINEPLLAEKDPYFEGWFYKIIPSDLDYEMQFVASCSSDRI